MKFFLSDSFQDSINRARIYLDNDFLNEIYHDHELYAEFISLTLNQTSLLIDPLTKFEFLRSIFMDVINREKFLSKEVFIPALNHPETFSKIQDNALTLSKIYANKNTGQQASVVDLFLAGRVLLDSVNNPKIITANAKDFPSCIFDLEAMISKVKSGNSIQSYCLMSFNARKFKQAYADLQKVK